MKRSKFAEMLESERNRFEHKQVVVAEWLSMSQSAYSRMEEGKTNPGIKRSLEIIKIVEAHGYVGIPPLELEEAEGKITLRLRWPWNKYVLYAILVILAIFLFDYILTIPGEIARGFEDGASGKPDPSPAKTLFASLLLVFGFIYGVYRLTKWFLSMKY